MGYSLVGVYPCALWKPQTCGDCPSESTAPAAAPGPVRAGRLASVRPTPYPQPEPCRCRVLEEPTCEPTTTPMLFVPYSYAPHLALGSNNSVSPSGNNTPLIKVGNNTIRYYSAAVINLKSLRLCLATDSVVYPSYSYSKVHGRCLHQNILR